MGPFEMGAEPVFPPGAGARPAETEFVYLHTKPSARLPAVYHLGSCKVIPTEPKCEDSEGSPLRFFSVYTTQSFPLRHGFPSTLFSASLSPEGRPSLARSRPMEQILTLRMSECSLYRLNNRIEKVLPQGRLFSGRQRPWGFLALPPFAAPWEGP